MTEAAKKRLKKFMREQYANEYDLKDSYNRNDLNKILGYMDSVMDLVEFEDLIEPEYAERIKICKDLMGGVLDKPQRGQVIRYPFSNGIEMIVKFE